MHTIYHWVKSKERGWHVTHTALNDLVRDGWVFLTYVHGVHVGAGFGLTGMGMWG